ncbi:hypothetical protein [Nocardioides sp. B-3]|uniref:hypothetical protein n=1 Tax=Nocardioides sp. B-3 TaxID=2895565 RepID=UPI0021524AA1|nr:hypothetical protein [Nocardioides sp. B-3]UUZ61525.1 hypothetical protein LP418_13775 [Nocardioides sp. B-3]
MGDGDPGAGVRHRRGEARPAPLPARAAGRGRPGRGHRPQAGDQPAHGPPPHRRTDDRARRRHPASRAGVEAVRRGWL